MLLAAVKLKPKMISDGVLCLCRRWTWTSTATNGTRNRGMPRAAAAKEAKAMRTGRSGRVRDGRRRAAEGFGSRKDALQSLIAKAKALKAQMDSL